ncbi:MAG: hypothetical protein EBT15_04875 [Betaproteobacteria bacterium]|nr:hypothetical protein [Betaproteobacteria bacterium]
MNNPVTPKEVYDSYPGADFLNVDPPHLGESFHDYVNRQGKQRLRTCGDTLFAFLLFELADAGSRADAVRMLNTAINDIVAVKSRIENEGGRHGQ